MPVSVEHAMQLLSWLAQEHNLRVAVKESLAGGLRTGLVTAVVSLGGALGGALAAWSSAGRFKSVATIILEMDHHQQLQLYNAVCGILQGITADDLLTLQALVRGDVLLRKMLLHALLGHIQGHMGMTIWD